MNLQYKLLLILLFTFLPFYLFTSKIQAAEYYVATNGSDSNPGTETQPWKTIQKSADTMSAGDTVYIRGGTYHETVYVGNSGTETAPITISSYPNEKAVIDGEYKLPGYWGVLFKVQGNYITVTDLEIKNSEWMGLVAYGHHVRLNRINSHHHKENGILITGDYGLVENSKVWQNAYSNVNCTNSRGFWASGLSAARNPSYAVLRKNEVYQNWGEGISSYEADHTILEDNIVYDNYSVNAYISDTSYTTLRGNIIYTTPGNACDCGFQTGIALSSEIGYTNRNNTIVNNLVYGNKINFYYWYSSQGANDGLIDDIIAHNTFANSRSQVNVKIQASGYHSNTVFKNNIILQEDYLPVSDLAPSAGIVYSHNLWSKAPSSGSGTGDVIDDPKLAKTGSTSAGQLTAGWFKLLADSPAINAGTALAEVTADFDNISRPQGSSYDIGAYEYVESNVSCPADINNDNTVNAADIIVVLQAWGSCNNCQEDLDANNFVNVADIIIVLQAWGEC